MRSRPSLRTLLMLAGIAALAGCGDDDDDGSGGAAMFSRVSGRGTGAPASSSDVEFFDDFSGSFPSPNWEIRRGGPFVTPHVGNPSPGLALRPFGDPIRVRSLFSFSGSEALTLTFDLATYELQRSSRFKARLRRTTDDIETSFEMRVDDKEIRMRISGSRDDDAYTFVADEGALFKVVKFAVDDEGRASWSVGGVTYTTGGFAPGTYRLDFDTSGGDRTKFVVDNVKLTRP